MTEYDPWSTETPAVGRMPAVAPMAETNPPPAPVLAKAPGYGQALPAGGLGPLINAMHLEPHNPSAAMPAAPPKVPALAQVAPNPQAAQTPAAAPAKAPAGIRHESPPPRPVRDTIGPQRTEIQTTNGWTNPWPSHYPKCPPLRVTGSARDAHCNHCNNRFDSTVNPHCPACKLNAHGDRRITRVCTACDHERHTTDRALDNGLPWLCEECHNPMPMDWTCPREMCGHVNRYPDFRCTRCEAFQYPRPGWSCHQPPCWQRSLQTIATAGGVAPMLSAVTNNGDWLLRCPQCNHVRHNRKECPLGHPNYDTALRCTVPTCRRPITTSSFCVNHHGVADQLQEHMVGAASNTCRCCVSRTSPQAPDACSLCARSNTWYLTARADYNDSLTAPRSTPAVALAAPPPSKTPPAGLAQAKAVPMKPIPSSRPPQSEPSLGAHERLFTAPRQLLSPPTVPPKPKAPAPTLDDDEGSDTETVIGTHHGTAASSSTPAPGAPKASTATIQESRQALAIPMPTTQAKASANQAPPLPQLEDLPAMPQLAVLPMQDTINRMRAGEDRFWGEHSSTLGADGWTYWMRFNHLDHYLSQHTALKLGTGGGHSMQDMMLTIHQLPYTSSYRRMPTSLRKWLSQNPFYGAIPTAHETRIARTAPLLPAHNHPLTMRRDQDVVDSTAFAMVTPGVRISDPRVLEDWSQRNAAGLTPANTYGWVELEKVPTAKDQQGNDTGIPIHHNNTQGRYHPRLVRDIGRQPHLEAQACRHWDRKGRCRLGSSCPNRHAEHQVHQALCASFFARRACVRTPCDFIHGYTINSATGRELRGDNNRLPYSQSTRPDFLTCSPRLPHTPEELAMPDPPVYFPIPTAHCYQQFAGNMTDALYGIRTSTSDEPVVGPTGRWIVGFTDAAIALVRNLGNPKILPAEVCRRLLEGPVAGIARALPLYATETYDPEMAHYRPRREGGDPERQRALQRPRLQPLRDALGSARNSIEDEIARVNDSLQHHMDTLG